MKMSTQPVPKRRKGIHPEKNDKTSDKEVELKQCEDCDDQFLVSQDGTMSKLNRDLADEWAKLEKKKDVQKDIDLQKDSRLKCKGCKESKSLSPTEKTHRVKSRRTNFFILVKKTVNINNYYLGPVLSILVVGLAIFYLWDRIRFEFIRNLDIPVNMEAESIADVTLEKELMKLEKSYSKQIEDTWITLQAGIQAVIRETPNQPSTFLMLFDSESSGKAAQCIANDVSRPAIRYLLEKSGTPETVNGADLNAQSYLKEPGILLKELNYTVRNKGALVVTDLHQVPPVVAKMFHFVCDKYSPLVERAVTFFTLKVKKVPDQMYQQKVAAETMRDLWGSVLDDTLLRPLITRMTSNIIRIYPDPNCS